MQFSGFLVLIRLLVFVGKQATGMKRDNGIGVFNDKGASLKAKSISLNSFEKFLAADKIDKQTEQRPIIKMRSQKISRPIWINVCRRLVLRSQIYILNFT